ncbi:MAG TPA: hypothetical protein PKK06_02910 [Phycisphaerae bacterium]|nr:hypothetical protein [Phycisphaerae bacterium]HNU44636.1 hypothetical protein [Phycisphaerae bacterium]
MIMPESTQVGGLCFTCNNRPNCFYRAQRGPALFCELFDDYEAPPLDPDGRRPVTAPVLAAAAVVGDVSGLAGLCLNCEHRHTCVHPKPAGGVWHCEDYE